MVHRPHGMTEVAMRGSDEVTGSLFSYVDLENRIPSRRCARSDPSSTMPCVHWMPGSIGFMLVRAALPSRWNARSAPACCKSSTRSVPGGSSWSRWTTTCCSGGSWASEWMTRFGCLRVHEEPRPAADTDMSRKIMAAILAPREVAPLLSDDHVSVDGTLVKGEPPKAAPV